MKRASFLRRAFASYELVYGAFAAIPVFLLWIYLSWLMVIGGAVLAALLPEWRRGQRVTGAAGSRQRFFRCLAGIESRLVARVTRARGGAVKVAPCRACIRPSGEGRYLEKIHRTLSDATRLGERALGR